MKNSTIAGKVKSDFHWASSRCTVYLFTSENLPDSAFSFETYLYLTPKHIRTQSSTTVYQFFLHLHNRSKASAVFQYAETSNKTFLSPPRAPFGGIQCDEECQTGDINFMLDCISSWAARLNAAEILIKTPPFFYNSDTIGLLSNNYISNGFIKLDTTTNHHLPITPIDFEKIIKKQELRRLKKCRLAGFTIEILSSPDAGKVYDFLFFCRKKKNYALSLVPSHFEELITQFPNDIIIFIVKDRDQIIALSVTVRVNCEVLYNFLSATLPPYLSYSPSVFLTESIYNFCRNMDFSVLDLGTSLDHHGREKPGLIRFKENMGGIPTDKVTYCKYF